MTDLSSLGSRILRRDRSCCRACGIGSRQVLAIHHVVPAGLGGTDSLGNLTTLCANCHRIVHWLSTGDGSLEAHAYGLGQSPLAQRRLLALARRIRRRRLRVVGRDLVLTTSVPLETAIGAVVTRNGLEGTDAQLFRRCLRRAMRAMAPADRRECSVRLVRGARFISVNANNHLAIRAPAWSDDGYRIDGDILLIWPQAVRPSVMSRAEFRRVSSGRFKLIPHFNLSLTWEECLELSERDWLVFRGACHEGLTLARTCRRTSNVLV